MIIKEGKAYPPTASGGGILLIVIGIIILLFVSAWSVAAFIWAIFGLVFLILGLWFNLSKAEVDTSTLSKGYFVRTEGFGQFGLKTKIMTKQFDAAIIKKVSLTYRVSQGIGAGMVINQGEYNEEVIGLFANYKGRLEDVLIIKASRSVLIQLINNELSRYTDWRYFDGGIHKTYELKPNSKP